MGMNFLNKDMSALEKDDKELKYLCEAIEKTVSLVNSLTVEDNIMLDKIVTPDGDWPIHFTSYVSIATAQEKDMLVAMIKRERKRLQSKLIELANKHNVLQKHEIKEALSR